MSAKMEINFPPETAATVEEKSQWLKIQAAEIIIAVLVLYLWGKNCKNRSSKSLRNIKIYLGLTAQNHDAKFLFSGVLVSFYLLRREVRNDSLTILKCNKEPEIAPPRPISQITTNLGATALLQK